MIDLIGPIRDPGFASGVAFASPSIAPHHASKVGVERPRHKPVAYNVERLKIELTEDELTLIVRALEQYHAYLVSQQAHRHAIHGTRRTAQKRRQ